MRFLVSTILSVLLVAGQSLRAEQPVQVDQELRHELARIVTQYELPGMVAALVEQGRVTRVAATGVRKLGDSEELTIADRIHLGSCTKAMTATILAQLVDAQKMTWNGTLAELLPDLSPRMHESFRGVTVRQLLTHRSGLPANSPLMHAADKSLSTRDQREWLFEQVLAMDPEYEPGTKARYSNLGYMLAGFVAETVSGDTWESLMRKRIFEPLQMDSADFGVPGTTGKLNQPWGHREVSEGEIRALQRDNPPVLGPAGTVHASLMDWAKFVAVHLKHQPRPPLLMESTIDEMHRPYPNGRYALGWVALPRWWSPGHAITHSGSNTMWMAVVWASPQRDFAFLAATNSAQHGAAKACDDAVRFLLEGVIKKVEDE